MQVFKREVGDWASMAQESVHFRRSPMAVSSLLNDTPHSDSYVGPSPGESIQYASEPCAKRRYRRHPKPDPHAPRKPQTAYIMFSNSIRSGGAYKHMSFTQSAQQVAEIWRTLAPHLRQPYLDRAEHERGVYREQIARYKLTPEYRDYQNYLRRFYSQAGQIGTISANQANF